MVLRAGRLRHKITIQSLTITRDASGGLTETWATYSQPKASVEPLNGREYLSAQQVNSELNIKFVIRYESGVTTKMRISWDSRTFDIKHIVNAFERNRSLELWCIEQT